MKKKNSTPEELHSLSYAQSRTLAQISVQCRTKSRTVNPRHLSITPTAIDIGALVLVVRHQGTSSHHIRRFKGPFHCSEAT